MPLSIGCNHVTVVTSDMDRLIAFYREIFDAELIFDQEEGHLRHAGLDLGGGFFLHPFQFPKPTSEAKGSDEMFSRGHIDHMALNFPDTDSFETARRRLVAAGASAGRVRDFGMVKILTFSDPDGMQCEIALWSDGPILTRAESSVEEFEPA